jgi:head-tail adaptor
MALFTEKRPLAGKLSERVQWYEPTFVRDAYGGESARYDLPESDHGWTWAEVREISGREAMIAQQYQAVSQWMVRIRNEGAPAISALWRATLLGPEDEVLMTFEVVHVGNPPRSPDIHILASVVDV